MANGVRMLLPFLSVTADGLLGILCVIHSGGIMACERLRRTPVPGWHGGQRVVTAIGGSLYAEVAPRSEGPD